ncbi:ribonuclease H-like domain-containing protein [Tanacetum coccineum]
MFVAHWTLSSNFMHPIHWTLLILLLIRLVAILPGGLHLVIVFSWEIIYSHGQPNSNILSLGQVLKLNTKVLLILLSKLPGFIIFSESFATLVYYDNVSAIYMTANLVQHQRTKHIEIDIHFVRDMVAHGQVHVLHVPSHYRHFHQRATVCAF